MIRFFDKAEPAEAGADGLTTYRLVTYFECYRDITTRIVRRARPTDITAYPKEHAVYEAARAGDDGGFPLVAWPGADEAVRLGLAERGIRSVEGLAAADLSAAPLEYAEAQARAVAFLDATRADAPKLAAEVERLRVELAERAEDSAELREEVARLEAENAALKAETDAGKPRRGRPRKNEEEDGEAA